MVQPKPRPGADPRAQEIKALKGMVAEQACKLDEQTCKLDEQADQIVLLINENIDLRATIVRLNEDKEELEVELRLRKKASRKPDIKPPARAERSGEAWRDRRRERERAAGAQPESVAAVARGGVTRRSGSKFSSKIRPRAAIARTSWNATYRCCASTRSIWSTGWSGASCRTARP